MEREDEFPVHFEIRKKYLNVNVVHYDVKILKPLDNKFDEALMKLINKHIK